MNAIHYVYRRSLGFLPFWNHRHLRPIPIRPLVFIATSLLFSRR